MTLFSHCPVCDGTDRSTYVAFDALEFVQCRGCDTVYKSREVPNALPPDFYERGYFEGRKSGREKRFAHRSRKAASWVSDAADLLPDGKGRLLDVGCSLGYVLEGARREGLTSAGVDVSAHAVSVCVGRGYEAKVGTIDAIPYEDAAFDVVVLKHVLEHTPTPKGALAEVKRVLGPSGVVLVALPDVHYWKGDRQRETYRYYRPDDLGTQHFVYYSTASLTRLLTDAGFHVRSTSKAVFRRRRWVVWEAVRFAALSVWAFLGRTTKLQQELYVIATRGN